MTIALSLIALALGYKVLTDASREKQLSFLRLLGLALGLIIVGMALCSTFCAAMKCMDSCSAMKKGYCPVSGK